MMRNKIIEPMNIRLKKALETNNKKQVDLHNDLGFSQALISQWMNGKVERMTTQNISKVAKYLNVSEVWLMGYDAPMSRDVPIEDPNNINNRFQQLSEEQKKRLLEYLEYLEYTKLENDEQE